MTGILSNAPVTIAFTPSFFNRDPDSHPPFPTHYPDEEPLENEDWFDVNLHNFEDPTIEFPQDESANKLYGV